MDGMTLGDELVEDPTCPTNEVDSPGEAGVLDPNCPTEGGEEPSGAEGAYRPVDAEGWDKVGCTVDGSPDEGYECSVIDGIGTIVSPPRWLDEMGIMVLPSGWLDETWIIVLPPDFSEMTGTIVSPPGWFGAIEVTVLPPDSSEMTGTIVSPPGWGSGTPVALVGAATLITVFTKTDDGVAPAGDVKVLEPFVVDEVKAV
jgi:hypothetical protein